MVNRRFILWFLFLLAFLGLVWPKPALASVDIVYFRSVSNQNSITLEWGTETELDLLGFLIYRGVTDELDNAAAISPLIPASGAPPTGGDDYSFNDTNVTTGSLYYYWLVSIDIYDPDPSEYSYEGPLSASTLGGTTINTPIPTTPGTTPAPTTPTPTLPPVGSSPTAVGTQATINATNTANPTATTQPSPTQFVEPSPTRIPAGTFPQPPTPTRFVFPATATAAAAGSTPNNNTTTNGDNSNATLMSGGVLMAGQATPTPGDVPGNGDQGDAVVPLGLPTSDPVLESFGGSSGTSSTPNGVDVIGQQIASQPQTTGQLPASGTTTSSPSLPIISPVVIMGLLVGLVFTFGGAVTVLFMLRRK